MPRRYPLVHPSPTPEEEATKKRRIQLRRWRPKGPFAFFSLPPELRRAVFEYLLVFNDVIDLDPQNYRTIARRLQIFLVSKKMHDEAFPVFYGQNTFRLFPIHKDFFNTESIILSRLPPRYRAAITQMDLRLGPHWANPPRCWTLGYGLSGSKRRDKSGLEDCLNLRKFHVFVEVDPSHPIFEGWRIDEDFYTDFCGGLLKRICVLAPALEIICFDGWESVKLEGPLMSSLRYEAASSGKRIVFGSERGWQEEVTGRARTTRAQVEGPVTPLNTAMAAISLQA